MPLADDSELKNVVVSIKKSQIQYLKVNGIIRSKFVRQAIDAHKAGKWDYKFTDEQINKQNIILKNHEGNDE